MSPQVDLNLEGDNAWPDLQGFTVEQFPAEAPWRVVVLPGGMATGRPSVALRFDLNEIDAQTNKPRSLVAETSARQWVAIARAIMAKYPDLLRDEPKTTEFEFDLRGDEDPLERAVFQALGAASVAWVKQDGMEVFDSAQATAIGQMLIAYIRDHPEIVKP